jgi:predicted nuclease with TOPRIM domain
MEPSTTLNNTLRSPAPIFMGSKNTIPNPRTAIDRLHTIRPDKLGSLRAELFKIVHFLFEPLFAKFCLPVLLQIYNSAQTEAAERIQNLKKMHQSLREENDGLRKRSDELLEEIEEMKSEGKELKEMHQKTTKEMTQLTARLRQIEEHLEARDVSSEADPEKKKNLEKQIQDENLLRGILQEMQPQEQFPGDMEKFLWGDGPIGQTRWGLQDLQKKCQEMIDERKNLLEKQEERLKKREDKVNELDGKSEEFKRELAKNGKSVQELGGLIAREESIVDSLYFSAISSKFLDTSAPSPTEADGTIPEDSTMPVAKFRA